MPHLILLGDSVFDNAAYTGGGPAVIDHLRLSLPPDWTCTLLAIDGSTTADIERQIAALPAAATHLVLSVGGNDALLHVDVLDEPVQSSGQAFGRLFDVVEAFRINYERTVAMCLKLRLPLVICTVYNGNFPGPEYQRSVSIAVSAFDDVIITAAVRSALRVIDLRLVCHLPEHFANPLEPSAEGGARIAQAIVRAVTGGPLPGSCAQVVA